MFVLEQQIFPFTLTVIIFTIDQEKWKLENLTIFQGLLFIKITLKAIFFLLKRCSYR